MFKKRFTKLFSLTTLFFAIVALCLGLAIYTLNAKYLVGDPMPMPMGIGISVVQTGSMEPTISAGDVVFIYKSYDIEPDDIIVYCNGRTPVLHRVKSINDMEIIAQGDANNAPDEPVSLADVKGKLWFRIPGGGRVVRILQHPATILAIAAVALFLGELAYRRDKKHESDELSELQKQIEELKSTIEETEFENEE